MTHSRASVRGDLGAEAAALSCDGERPVRSPRRAADLRALLLRGPILAVEGLRDWEGAAQHHRWARSKGLTVRSGIDCLIASVALRMGSPVLALDRDFEALAQVSDLVLEHP